MKKNKGLKEKANILKKAKEKINIVKKEKKEKPKKSKLQIFLIVLTSLFIIFFGLVVFFGSYIILTAPEFDSESIYNQPSTTLFDKNGNEIAKLGVEKRQTVTYDELPQVFIDALVATEDARFFQHNGFDIARFTKATLGQLAGQSSAGGGSTLTMQLSKNHVTDFTATGFAGIVRKFTDIYIAVFKIEKNYTKEQIIEFYVNTPYMSNNSYGVEQACQNYFGKSVSDLTLTEAALIAGMFQAPESYNPFTHPELATKRRNNVLNLMVKHGYITEEEKELAASIPVKSLLTTGKVASNKWQMFVDTVIDEIETKAKINPFTTPLLVYTTMDPDKQETMNELKNGEIIKFKDDAVEMGVALTDVKDGSLVAIMSGRNMKNVERPLNLATRIKRQPGSTAKPLLVYGTGIEYNNWSTYTPFFDEEYTYSTGGSIKNADGKYMELMTLEDALAQSRNIPALQAFQQLKPKDMSSFIHSLGVDYGETLYESASTGGFDGMSPLQMSAAYGAFARGGYYIEPYSYTKLVYISTGEEIVTKVKKTQVMSEETAYMINDVLKKAANVVSAKLTVSGTDVCSKTGTTTISGDKISSLKLPSTAINDSWIEVYSPDYSFAMWYGYKELTKESASKGYYLIMRQASIVRRDVGVSLSSKMFKKDSTFTRPSGVVDVEIELETIPGLLASPYTPSTLKQTYLFKKGTEPTETSYRFIKLNDVTNLEATYNNGYVSLTWDALKTPDAIDTKYLQNYFNNNYSSWAQKYYDRRIAYNNSFIGTLVYHIYIQNDNGTLTSLGTTASTSYNYPTSLTSGSYKFVIKSEYSIFKDNASAGKSVTVDIETINKSIDVLLNVMASETVSIGTGYYSDSSKPFSVYFDGEDVTSASIFTTTIINNATNNTVDKIPLNVAGSYTIGYQVTYSSYSKTIKRTVTIK